VTSSAAIVVQAMAAAKRYMGRSPSARIDEARPLAHSSREGSERTTTLVRANRATEALKIRILAYVNEMLVPRHPIDLSKSSRDCGAAWSKSAFGIHQGSSGCCPCSHSLRA
jgi:hypothetical protein